MLSKILLIQNNLEFNYVESKKKLFRNYIKILWYPVSFKIKNYDNYIIASNFLKLELKNNCDINYEYSFNIFLKKIDSVIRKEIPFYDAKINILQNARGELKNFLDFYYNEFAKLDYLIKNFKFNKICIFETNEKKKFDLRLNYILTLIKKKIKIQKISISFGLLNLNKKLIFYHNHNLLPDFLKKQSFLKKIKDEIKFFKNNKSIAKKKKILLFDATKEIVDIFNQHKTSSNIMYLNSFYDNSKNLNISDNSKLIISKQLKKFLNKKKINFYKKKTIINLKEFFFDFINYLYPITYSAANNILKKLAYLNQKNNFETCISTYENFCANIAHDYFVNNNKKYLALSHGGTIGHYINSPRVPYYNLTTNLYSFYQSFSKRNTDYMNEIIKKNQDKNFNIIEIPHIKMTYIKKKLNFQKNKKKEIVYFASPLDGYLDSKFGTHNEFDILKIREKFFNCTNKFIINYRQGYYSEINNKYTEYLLKKNNQINILSSKIKIEEILNKNSIIICEGNSTAIIESLLTNNPIILFQRKFPKFNKESLDLLSKRVLILKNTNEILNFFDNFDKNIIRLNSLNNNDKSFLEKFYNYHNLKKNLINQSINNFLRNKI